MKKIILIFSLFIGTVVSAQNIKEHSFFTQTEDVAVTIEEHHGMLVYSSRNIKTQKILIEKEIINLKNHYFLKNDSLVFKKSPFLKIQKSNRKVYDTVYIYLEGITLRFFILPSGRLMKI